MKNAELLLYVIVSMLLSLIIGRTMNLNLWCTEQIEDFAYS